jgi:hypothetical protein
MFTSTLPSIVQHNCETAGHAYAKSDRKNHNQFERHGALDCTRTDGSPRDFTRLDCPTKNADSHT